MQRGSLRKRGSTWTAYYFTQIDGRRVQRAKGGFRTKAEAQSHLNEALAQIQRGEYVEPVKLTLGQYLMERWLPLMEHSLRPSTLSSYETIVRLHVMPRLGDVPLQALTADQLDGFYAELLRSGRRNGVVGSGLSPKSVRHVHTLLQKALRDAVRKRLITRNVAVDADPPKLRQASSPEMKTWTAPQLRQFLGGMSDHSLAAAFTLAATTGMRRGEVLGVRWRDIDLAKGQLAVRQTVLNVRYGVVVGAPKTPRSRRTLALDSRTVAVLTEHRETQAELKRLVGERYVDQDFVFTRPDGSPIHPDYLSQTFERSVRRLGLPKIRLHDLRHTHATLGLAAGVPAKVMSERLGHATVSFTLDVYTHAIPSMGADAAQQVSDLIFGQD